MFLQAILQHKVNPIRHAPDPSMKLCVCILNLTNRAQWFGLFFSREKAYVSQLNRGFSLHNAQKGTLKMHQDSIVMKEITFTHLCLGNGFAWDSPNTFISSCFPSCVMPKLFL